MNIDEKEKEIQNLKQKNDYLNDLEASAVEYKELKNHLQQKENIIKEVRNWVKSTIDIIKQQPTGNDEWILERLNGFLWILDKEVN